MTRRIRPLAAIALGLLALLAILSAAAPLIEHLLDLTLGRGEGQVDSLPQRRDL